MARNYLPIDEIAVRRIILVDDAQSGQVGDQALYATNNGLSLKPANSGIASSLSTLMAAFKLHAIPQTVAVNAVHAAITLGVGGTVATGITNPVVPSVLSITGVGAGATGNVVLTGTNFNDAVITDTIALAGATTVNGTKAFKTVSLIAFPADSGATGETVAIGVTKIVGLHHILSLPVKLAAFFNGAADTGVLTADALLEKNVFAINGTPDGVKALDLYYLIS